MTDRFKIKDRTRIAKVGVWNGHNITESMLKRAVKLSDAKLPITRGHIPLTGQESEGNLSNLEYKDGAVWADRTLYDKLAKDWQEERFINQSAEFRKYNGEWRFAALALTGDEKPGMKGLLNFAEELTENNQEILRFTEKLNEEVSMPEMNDFQKGYEAGLLAKENELKLQFSESQEKTVSNAVEKVTLKFNEEKAKLEKKVEGLETQLADQKKLQFNEKIEEVVKTVPEKDQEKVKAELVQFSEKLEYDLFAKMADKYKVKPVKIKEEMHFSESGSQTEEDEIDELLSKSKH